MDGDPPRDSRLERFALPLRLRRSGAAGLGSGAAAGGGASSGSGTRGRPPALRDFFDAFLEARAAAGLGCAMSIAGSTGG